MNYFELNVRRYIVGIQYQSSNDYKGYFEIRRKTTLKELAEEVLNYLLHGKTSYPAFPPEADPEVLYAWDMCDWDDGDCYPDLMTEIDTILLKGGEFD